MKYVQTKISIIMSFIPIPEHYHGQLVLTHNFTAVVEVNISSIALHCIYLELVCVSGHDYLCNKTTASSSLRQTLSMVPTTLTHHPHTTIITSFSTAQLLLKSQDCICCSSKLQTYTIVKKVKTFFLIIQITILPHAVFLYVQCIVSLFKETILLNLLYICGAKIQS